jgi:hypothetical protein
MGRYTQTFLWLQQYDEGLLEAPKGKAGGIMANSDYEFVMCSQVLRSILRIGQTMVGVCKGGTGVGQNHFKRKKD